MFFSECSKPTYYRSNFSKVMKERYRLSFTVWRAVAYNHYLPIFLFITNSKFVRISCKSSFFCYISSHMWPEYFQSKLTLDRFAADNTPRVPFQSKWKICKFIDTLEEMAVVSIRVNVLNYFRDLWKKLLIFHFIDVTILLNNEN